jgi:hypothetical protein
MYLDIPVNYLLFLSEFDQNQNSSTSLVQIAYVKAHDNLPHESRVDLCE